MKTKTIPFDLETAKKIQAGEIKGKIKTRDSKDVDEIVSFGTPLEYSIYAVINEVCHSFTEEGYERSWDKSGKWRGDLVLEVSDNEPQFKPFEKVLCRDYDDDIWRANLFSHNAPGLSFPYYVCGGNFYKQCIPYDGNEQLVGTTNKPEK